MDTVIKKLSEIENAAGSILDSTAARKKALAAEMEEKTAAFDAALEKETADRIAAIQKKMEAEMNAMLSRQTADSEVLLKRLEENYENQHETYVEVLFAKMIKRY